MSCFEYCFQTPKGMLLLLTFGCRLNTKCIPIDLLFCVIFVSDSRLSICIRLLAWQQWLRRDSRWNTVWVAITWFMGLIFFGKNSMMLQKKRHYSVQSLVKEMNQKPNIKCKEAQTFFCIHELVYIRIEGNRIKIVWLQFRRRSYYI